MHCCNHTLISLWRHRFSIMLQLKLELNFKNDAARCMCRDNQKDVFTITPELQMVRGCYK